MKKDPYYTYMNYSPCKPVVHKICWIVPLLVIAAALTFAVAWYYGAALLSILQGG